VAREILDGCDRTRTVDRMICSFTASHAVRTRVPCGWSRCSSVTRAERRINSLKPWNAAGDGVRSNKGGAQHRRAQFSTYASRRLLYEVGFKPLFSASERNFEGDTIYFQDKPRLRHLRAHIWRGAAAREAGKFLRRELKPGGGLSSYPHPWRGRTSAGNFSRAMGLLSRMRFISALTTGILKISGLIR